MLRSIAPWVGRRVLGALLTLVVASVIIYSTLRLVPGDPVLALSGGRRLNAAQIEALRHSYGLDQGFAQGYLVWITDALHLDLGRSLVYQTSVTSLLTSRLGVSGLLIVYSALLATVFGLGVGLLSAVKGGLVNRAASILASVSTATPTFLAAIGLLTVFSVNLGWFPATGAGTGFGDRIWHLTLPAFAMAIAVFGVLARLSTVAFTEELGREHVEVARSRGIGGGAVIARHVVRNALPPLLTVIGLLVATLFVGTAVVESAFGLDGVGSLLVRAVSRRDFPVVQGIALIAVALFVVVNTLVDLVTPFVDPRITSGGPAR
ncbi:ABC transporter permease [Streptomyces adustus]|uniref:ABC transporter permease n=1 Tax=Streptomyces adustus TaxID=1609272 RepID=UPI0037233BAC